jgi:hypothetical protein
MEQMGTLLSRAPQPVNQQVGRRWPPRVSMVVVAKCGQRGPEYC